MDRIGVVILHYLDKDLTSACLRSVLSSDLKNKKLDLIVVSNSQDKDLATELKKIESQVQVIENEANLGYSAANNKGIKKALEEGCSKVILLNNDTVVDKNLINNLTEFSDKNNKIGLVSPKIYFAPGHEYRQNRYNKKDRGKVIWYAGGKLDRQNVYAGHLGIDEIDRGQFESTNQTDFATGCCMLITRDAVDKVGLFDEMYFMYFEDIDYSLRVRRSGFQVVYYPYAYLWHKNASTSGSPGSYTHIYYQTRNRLYFGFKYFSWRVKKSLLLDSLRLGFRGGAYLKGVYDYYLGRMGKMRQ